MAAIQLMLSRYVTRADARDEHIVVRPVHAASMSVLSPVAEKVLRLLRRSQVLQTRPDQAFGTSDGDRSNVSRVASCLAM